MSAIRSSTASYTANFCIDVWKVILWYYDQIILWDTVSIYDQMSLPVFIEISIYD